MQGIGARKGQWGEASPLRIGDASILLTADRPVIINHEKSSWLTAVPEVGELIHRPGAGDRPGLAEADVPIAEVQAEGKIEEVGHGFLG
jgi:hypothetical protein